MTDVNRMADDQAKCSHTPGPWRWEVNMASRIIELCGGRPTYDMTVMDFARWGMSSARPRFTVDGLLHDAEEFKRVAPDREHHASWFQLLDHPDANLIAAAPELLAACKAALLQMCLTNSPCNAFTDAVDALDAAIAKAEARS
jgi:hypothetical protein